MTRLAKLSILLALSLTAGVGAASDDFYGYQCAYAGEIDCVEHRWTTPDWGGEHGLNSLGACNGPSETMYEPCDVDESDERESAYDWYYYHAAGY